MAGTKVITSLFLFSLLVTCRSSNSQNNQGSSELESSDNNEEQMFDKHGNTTQNNSKLPLPEQATAESTVKLMISHPHPPLLDLKTCSDELLAMSEQSPNEESMLQTQVIMVGGVRKNSSLYHWCFFHMTQQLDYDLQNDNLGLLLEKRMENFLKRMKALWILARSLDQALESKKYFEYIRSRYIQLSLDYFARNLDVVSPPIGSTRPSKTPKMDKPAGEIQEPDASSTDQDTVIDEGASEDDW